MKRWRVYRSHHPGLWRRWVAFASGDDSDYVMRFQTHAEAIRYAQERAVCYRILDDIESGKYENP